CEPYEYCGVGSCQLEACSTHQDCAADAICAAGACRQGCEGQEDCAADEVCNGVSFTCEPAGCTPDSCGAFQVCDDSDELAVCRYDGSCDNDVICGVYARQNDLEGDYICQNSRCVQKPPCVEDSDCKGGELCIQVEHSDNF